MKNHWNKVYSSRNEEQLGWYEQVPEPSLRLLSCCEIEENGLLLDVGCGVSSFIGHLIDRGFTRVVGVDVSEAAISRLKTRLEGEKYSNVELMVEDVTKPVHLQHLNNVALWHDRAVLHFLLEEEDRLAYLQTLKRAVKKDGYVIIAAFSPTGAKKCSGLPIKNYDEAMLDEFLGADFELLKHFNYIHHMPSGDLRPYVYTLFKRR